MNCLTTKDNKATIEEIKANSRYAMYCDTRDYTVNLHNIDCSFVGVHDGIDVGGLAWWIGVNTIEEARQQTEKFYGDLDLPQNEYHFCVVCEKLYNENFLRQVRVGWHIGLNIPPDDKRDIHQVAFRSIQNINVDEFSTAQIAIEKVKSDVIANFPYIQTGEGRA